MQKVAKCLAVFCAGVLAVHCLSFQCDASALHQQIRREISRGVFRAIFDLRPHLVVDILNFEPFVTRVTDIDGTVKSLFKMV